ncbi:tRNA (adenosine(37)-N6)-threonylcarbamoyltransferase complex ATPase subunit type 1 TsaE [Bacillus xiapuensis]|uniref:tRNA (adenosine(37)-N6)-threonylcarbamoyltransferase complex ATPase subunit type 1 TsaE n=1 Tax=Bacillus xiapuensis TaxID=2014075 RepID=UPI000C23C83B|nr:tRNA (adenosine(37)-N6)-threonylcarbamoyltransferase complex ATPase subunit type 1 TsaE [Bacillus xiapuensis]
MHSLTFSTKSAEQTQAIAERLAQLLQPGDVLLLEGDLGAGKTTFTKGLAKGLGVRRTVNSPTFTIIKEYMGRMPLYHMDVYRVQDGGEDLGFDEYFYGEGVCVVEWAHLIEEQLPAEYLKVVLLHKGNDERQVELKPVGSRYELMSKELVK